MSHLAPYELVHIHYSEACSPSTFSCDKASPVASHLNIVATIIQGPCLHTSVRGRLNRLLGYKDGTS